MYTLLQKTTKDREGGHTGKGGVCEDGERDLRVRDHILARLKMPASGRAKRRGEEESGG